MRRFTLIGLLLTISLPVFALPKGQTFYVSFDKLITTADIAAGDPKSTFTANLELRSTEGIKGSGLLQLKGERCTYNLAGNLDTAQGTYSVWVKPLNWDGHSGKFRHFLVASGDQKEWDGMAATSYTMLLYLYCVGDEAVLNLIQLNARTPQEATSRAGAPVDILKKGEWTHLVSTWDAKSVRIYANGKQVGENLTSGKLPKLTSGTFTVCPIEYWAGSQWSDPEERTICDEVRIFDHALSEDEVLDLYAMDVPGGLADLKPSLTVNLKPDYFGKKLAVSLKPAHLDAPWQQRLPQAIAKLTVTDPKGAVIHEATGPLSDKPVSITVKTWVDGDYKASATVTAAGETLAGEAKLTKPPTPWLPKVADWRADRVLAPWTPLSLTAGTVNYWNGEVSLPGALPTQIEVGGQDILAGPISLVADKAATWTAPKTDENKPCRVSTNGSGKLGTMTASYRSLMEFDGLIRSDVTLTPPAGGAQVQSLTLEIPLKPEVAKFYRNPFCQEFDGKSLEEKEFLPYAWLGNEQRGLSWFMESSANWRQGKDQPAMTIRREGEAVVVRLRLISEPTKIVKPITYTFGFEPTPVRPPNPNLYDLRFASGPQFKGSNYFVYGWGPQVSALNASLLAREPEAERKLVDGWRATDKHNLDYSCVQCTANLSPEYLFFGDEWNQPYGGSFSGYKRVPDNAPYSMVAVCPQSSFPEYLLWCAKQNLDNDWSDGIYTDIDGATPCDNALHGCGFTDAFGRSGRTWPLYAHRSVSRRLYADCLDHKKLYFSHAHSYWYSLFNAFNDGWCPGEQYSSAVIGKPHFYMTDIPDRTWRTEMYTPTTGAPAFLLPELDRLTNAVKDRGPSECLMAASMCYGVPLWAGSCRQDVVEEAWAAQIAFGMKGATFTPYWEQQEFTVSDPEVRVSYWSQPGKRLVVLSNFTDKDKPVTLTAKAGAVLKGAWKAEGMKVEGNAATVTVPAYNGLLLTAEGL
ncbi:MAG: glycoside hydrolase domain-containing protein [Armatimonadota bacterium]